MRRAHIVAGLSMLALAALVLLLLPREARLSAAQAADSQAAPVEKIRKNRFPAPEGWAPHDQDKALLRAQTPAVPMKKTHEEDPLRRQQRLRRMGLSAKDMPASYLLLASPLVHTCEDKYGPVRFMHAKHSASLDNNCALCHHYRPAGADAVETVACRACHRESFEDDAAGELGLKAAYHQQCIGCHEEMHQGPVNCEGCHAKTHVDHKDLVKLPEDPAPQQVTRECLRCHRKAGEDMLESAHWLWRGPSPYTVEQRKEVMSGKATDTINNFCVAVPSNWPRCTSCHAGYGWKDETFDFTDMSNIDCLVCHDTTGSYKKAPPKAGLPDPSVDLEYVAKNVGRTTRSTCGVCHFGGGGGDAVKHADMSSQLHYPNRTCDVHMGGYDFTCTECHTTRNHKIWGRSSSVPVAEGSRTCVDCHSDAPHYGETLLDHHLNKHCDAIACNTCHSPIYAKCRPTKTWWDWSLAGNKSRTVHKDRFGMPDYLWKKGEFRWKESAKPEYAWHNGYTERLLIGDAVNMTGAVVQKHEPTQEKMQGRYIHITEPLGCMADPGSRIAPFKIMRGVQAADPETGYLLVPHLFPANATDAYAYWKNLDWDKAFQVGMKATGLPYSGRWDWVRTDMYWRIEHEVMPKELALSCVQCHDALQGERTCDRCHQDSRDADFKKLTYKGVDFGWLQKRGRDVGPLVNATDYIDFKALGYAGDPIIHGGRFKKLPLGYKKGGE
ncbi:MAG: tetrathionate reductase family octaheme c-type cytochrome [Desulfovibrionaceae bacterium]